jgi:2,4-dienoyl-CoA reductase-like NADH-dependent reductase (Old Yellow Enzyme family)
MASTLFSRTALRDMTVSNRIVISPMCQYSAIDGSATDWHLVHLGQMAMSGAGLLILEATHVEARGRITPKCLGLYSDENEIALSRVIAFCREHGSAKLGIQLSHAGRKGSARLPWDQRGAPLDAADGGWPTLSCSGIRRGNGWPVPETLDAAGLQAVKAAHVDATRRADRLGLDLIEVNAAHGYLLHEFLSPYSNRREDAYGGDLENRMRYPLDVFAAMRAAWPDDKPMGMRISATDWLEGGWDVDQSVIFCGKLKALGCDFIAVSSGGLSLDQVIPLDEGHQVPFAEKIRAEAQIPTMAVGMIYQPRHADSIIAEQQADFVAMARGMLFHPHWPWRAAAALDADVDYPPQYVRAYKSKWLRDMEGG